MNGSTQVLPRRTLILIVAGLELVVLLLTSSVVAFQPVKGFASYQVSLVSHYGQHSVLVNETVGPSDRAGYADMILQILGKGYDLTYSKLVNASDYFFPYLPTLPTNQSFNISNSTRYTVHVNLTAARTTIVTFNVGQYTLNVLAIAVSASYETWSVRLNGTVETFPSTLVYSATLGNSKAMLHAVLQATDLPLVSPSPVTATAAYVGAGVGIGALVLGGAFLIRRRGKNIEKKGEKRLHWVD